MNPKPKKKLPDARRDLASRSRQIGKIRPVLILSVAYQDNQRAVISYVPRTTSPRGTRFEVEHQQRGLKPGVFEAQMIGTAPDAKLMRKMGAASPEKLEAVEDAVRAWLGLK